MTRLLAFASFVCFCVASLAAAALTLEPIPGSTPQSTRPYSYFPNPIGVVVRDSPSGSPVSEIPITFSWIGGNVPYLIFPGDNDIVTVKSGPDGVAVPPEGFIAGAIAGTLVLTATTSQVGVLPATFQLTILPGLPTRVELVSGDRQRAQVGTFYAKPWVVRALDADGQPVPYAAIDILVTSAVGWPTGTLDGLNAYLARADASGVLTTPHLLAGPIAGLGYALFSVLDGPWTYIFFENVLGPVAASATLVSGPPQSVEVGHTALAPWVVKVAGFSGEPLAGVAVDFVTVSSCGTFSGTNRVTVMTDGAGLATSPLFTGTDAVMCGVWTESPSISLNDSLDLTMHVFNPALVVITPSDRFIETRPGRAFSVEVAFTEWDLPIYGPPFTVQVVAAPNGASATLTRQQAPFDSNVATLDFFTNGKQGYYAIVITRGPVRTWIAVEQRKH